VRAGRPDCLLLQDTAGGDAVQAAGVFGLGQQATDWSHRGLGAVLPAMLNAGLSGMTSVYSAVGGTSTVSSWAGRRRGRSDELLSRWAELQAFGALLVTADGDRPAGTPQVWDSPARLQAFVRSSRVFAALAQYRRSSLRQAERDGLPVVRPVWLAEPGLSQDSTQGEYFFGRSLLVVPVLTAGARTVQAKLPPGTWVNLFTGERYDIAEPAVPAGGATATDVAVPEQVTISASLGRPVVLYRLGDDDGAAARQALAGAGLLAPSQPPSGVPDSSGAS
jgi:alpha-glucosidase